MYKVDYKITKEAWQAIIDNHETILKACFPFIYKNWVEIDDLVQEARIHVGRYLKPKFLKRNKDEGELRKVIFYLAKMGCTNYWSRIRGQRKKSLIPDISLDFQFRSSHDEAAEQINIPIEEVDEYLIPALVQVDNAMEQLTEKQAKYLEGEFWHDMSIVDAMKEAGYEFKNNSNTSKQRKKILGALKREFEKLNG